MLVVLVSAALSAGATPTGVTLTGVVSDKAGRPLPGATVFVRMATPRKGVGVL
jgi:hypothetical protein